MVPLPSVDDNQMDDHHPKAKAMKHGPPKVDVDHMTLLRQAGVWDLL